MPTVNIYIPEKIWAAMMKAHKYDKHKVLAEIREMLRAKYGQKTV